MHITIITLGSRHGVQPCTAPGRGLKAAGYQVRVATYRIFASLIESYGLEFAPIEGNPHQTMEGQAGQRWLASGRNPLEFMRSRAATLGEALRAEGGVARAVAVIERYLGAAREA